MWVRRWQFESVRCLVALTALAVITVITTDPPADWEVSLFRGINDLSRSVEWVLWPLQQAGMLLAVLVAAVVLWFVVRHWRPPMALVIGGVALGWGFAKVVKELVGRGRPGGLLTDVRLGYDVPSAGLGFPSGHVVVVFTIVVVFSPYLPRWLRWTLYALALVVAFSRVYMGAHMPLDVFAGAALGVFVGSLINLGAGLRRDRVRPEALRLV